MVYNTWEIGSVGVRMSLIRLTGVILSFILWDWVTLAWFVANTTWNLVSGDMPAQVRLTRGANA